MLKFCKLLKNLFRTYWCLLRRWWACCKRTWDRWLLLLPQNCNAMSNCLSSMYIFHQTFWFNFITIRKRENDLIWNVPAKYGEIHQWLYIWKERSQRTTTKRALADFSYSFHRRLNLEDLRNSAWYKFHWYLIERIDFYTWERCNLIVSVLVNKLLINGTDDAKTVVKNHG